MAGFALSVPAFIGCSSDAWEIREAAVEVMERLRFEASRERISLEPVTWDRAVLPGVGRPQDLINPEVGRAELVVIIIHQRAGAGTLEELERSFDAARTGKVDLFVFLRRGQDGDVSTLRERFDREDSLLYAEYDDVKSFVATLERHLRLWLNRWTSLPVICETALRRFGLPEVGALTQDNLLFEVLHGDPWALESVGWQALGSAAVALYQTKGGLEAWQESMRDIAEGNTLHRFIERARPGWRFSSPQAFMVGCAIGLYHALRSGQDSAVSRECYANPIHQTLVEFVESQRPIAYDLVCATLRSWLQHAPSPVTRNFAAYELGMLGCLEAEADLIRALAKDRGVDVRRYCVTSLGKLESRRSIDALKQLYLQHDDLRLHAACALARIIGVARYEL